MEPTDAKAPREIYDKGPAVDPSPVEDLPSDIEFRWWLLRLKPEKVIQDLEGRVTYEEARHISEARYAALQDGMPIPRGPKRDYT